MNSEDGEPRLNPKITFVMEFALPELRRLGAPEEALHQTMVENPRRVLTFAKPG